MVWGGIRSMIYHKHHGPCYFYSSVFTEAAVWMMGYCLQRDKWLIGWSISLEDLITVAQRALLSSPGSLKSH